MLRPTAISSTINQENMDACRGALNLGTTEGESQKPVDDTPSQVSFVFDFPSEETNICFNINPSLRKMTASCYDNGTRTFLKGKCERSRSSKDYENPSASANSVKQLVILCNQPPPNKLLSAANSIDLCLEDVHTKPNSFSFDQASNNYKIKPTSTVQKIRHNFSAGSVSNAENFLQATGRSDLSGAFDESKRWVETTPEIIETVTSYTNDTSSATSCLLEKQSDVRAPRSSLHSTRSGKKSRERCADHAKEVIYSCIDNAIASKKNSLSFEKSIRDVNNEITTPRGFKDSYKTAKFVANVAVTREKQRLMSRKSSTEIACMELTEGIEESNSKRTNLGLEKVHKEEFSEEESSATSQLTESECENSLSREPLGPTKSLRPIVQLEVDTESSTESELTKVSINKKTKSKIYHKRTFKELYKLFQSYLQHNKHKHKSKKAFVEVFQKTAKEFFEGEHDERGQNGVEENLQRADDEFVWSEPSSFNASRTSRAETYNIDSIPSDLSIEMEPTESETTDFFDGSEMMYQRVTKDLGRKKKSPLYSETQSSGIVPEARNFDAGTSVATSSVATEGDGTSNRRLAIDRSVRIGHTSMNYFLSWEADDLVQQEHMYNSTNVGVQDGGNESRKRSRNGALPKRKCNNRRLDPEDVRVTEVDIETSSMSASNAGGVKDSREFIREKESVFQDEFLVSDRSHVDERFLSEPIESTDYLSENQSFEDNSSRDFDVNADTSKTSTHVYTLFSSTKVPEAETQSESEPNQDREVRLLFSKNKDMALEESSCYGLLPKQSSGLPNKVVPPTTRPLLCSSDETYAAKKKKRHRLTKQAQLFLQAYDRASTDSEECVSVDQLDVTNSSIILRRKSQKKPSGGMIFLRLRRTHPCRNLPRLMLKQENRSSLSVCSAEESSDSQLIKEVSLEDIKDYSTSFCKHTASMKKLSNPKWIKSMDDFIDFAYIVPKITKGNNEQIFKKGAVICKKLLEKNSEVEKIEPVVIPAKKSVVKRPSITLNKGRHNPEMMSKLRAFRADRKRKYNLVKVDTSAHVPGVESQSVPLNKSQHVRANEVSRCGMISQSSKDNTGNIKKPTENIENYCGSKINHAVPGKRRVSAFLGCLTVQNSDNVTAPRSKATGKSTTCNESSNKNVPTERKPVEHKDEKCSNYRFTVGRETMRKIRGNSVENADINNVSDCSSIRKEVKSACAKKVMESEEKKSTDTSGREAATTNTKIISAGLGAKDIVPSQKVAGKNMKENNLAIGTGKAVDSRRKTKREIRNRLKESSDCGSTSDCVEKVSFDKAYHSLRDKKESAVMSDDSWTSVDTSPVSGRDRSRSIVPEVPNGITEQKLEIIQVYQNSPDSCARNRTESADPVKRYENLRSKTSDNVKSYINGNCCGNNQVDVAKSSKESDNFATSIEKRGKDFQRIYTNSNASVKRDSFELNSNTESKCSNLKCSTPTSLRTSSNYQPDSAQSKEKQKAIVTNSAYKVEPPTPNRQEGPGNIKQADSLRSNRSPRSIFKSVQKPKKILRNPTPVAQPILNETQNSRNCDPTAEEKISAKTVMDARRRAAEYDRRNRLRQRRALDIQKQDSVRSTCGNGAPIERERFINTGQAVLTTTGT